MGSTRPRSKPTSSRKRRKVVPKYLTRNQALRRLQVSLKDFRRLCILKGIYPREPKRKPSGSDKTYYLLKDVRFLMHEPILDTFREHKVWVKRLKRAFSRKEFDEANRIRLQRPRYKLDHLVRERYPTFIDAIRDIDDALSMVFLFATLPSDEIVKHQHVSNCLRLAREFLYYVVESKSLRKVFVSIKGYYFQAEILGQPVTWICPHNYPQNMPPDVDYRVMMTFLEFYEVLLSFVNYRLFQSLGLAYPPHMIADEGLCCPSLLTSSVSDESGENYDDSKASKGTISSNRSISTVKSSNFSSTSSVVDTSAAMASLESKLAEIGSMQASNMESDSDDDEGDELGSSDEEFDSEGSEIPEIDMDAEVDSEDDNSDAGSMASDDDNHVDEEGEFGDDAADAFARNEEELVSPDMNMLQNLFSGSVFFLSRETPVAILDFVIRAFGGRTSWETCTLAGSFPESSTLITHQIMDRPSLRGKLSGREYIQPQWVFDSVNARILLPVEPYLPGAVLPAHLSPFIDDEKRGYIPEQAIRIRKLVAEALEKQTGKRVSLIPDSLKAGIVHVEDGDIEDITEEEEALRYRSELAAEASGVSFSDLQTMKKDGKSAASSVSNSARSIAQDFMKKQEKEEGRLSSRKRLQEHTDEKDRREMQRMLLTRKRRKFYDHVVKKHEGRDRRIRKLENRRQKLDQNETS